MDTNKHHYFILLETVIYLGFLAGDLFAYDTSLIKYAGIVLCLIRALYRRNGTIALAFGFTLLADFFLLLLNRYYLAGVCFFIVVQFIYLCFLYVHQCRLFPGVRVGMLAAGVVLLFLTDEVSVLNAAVLFYFTLLSGNTISSFSNPSLRMMFFGFLLFICCDLCVGMHNILNNGWLYDLVSFGMWFFYLPSQVLICLGSEKTLMK